LLLGPAPHHTAFATFQCGTTQFEAVAHGRGVLVNIKNDSMKLKELLTFKETSGLQEPSTWHLGELGEEETTFLETLSGHAERSGLANEVTIKKEEKLELNAVL
jgi:hypothetical protein